MMEAGARHDVVVIGGGPAGAVAATALARAGRDVALFERERFPRFHIGESLLPLTGSVFRAIGVADALAQEGFTQKHGATFISEDGSVTFRAAFSDVLPRDRAKTLQVLRSRFDEVLLRHAEDLGVRVFEGCRVHEVRFAQEEVEVDSDAGQTRACAIIDASGRQGFLARRLGLRRPDARLRKVAVYGHFTGVPQVKGEQAGDIRIVSRADLGWLWFIPLAGGTTSVGAVFDRGGHADTDPDEVLAAYITETPAAARLMEAARPVAPARFEADFSYTVDAYAGERWLLAGDAGAFLDPVFSTGVHLASLSGWEAASALIDGRRGAIRAYERQQRRRVRFYRRIVAGFYDAGFRDLLFRPSPPRPFYNAIVAALAGDDRPSLRNRALMTLFHLLTRIHRLVALAPRLHGDAHGG